MAPLRMLHLVGSATNDFYAELSLLYARDCLTKLTHTSSSTSSQSSRYIHLIAYITPDRRWRFPPSLRQADIASAESYMLSDAVRMLALQQIDFALPQMFCLPGMTEYRALLQLLQIPYVGNLPAQMAIAADKAKAKAIVAAAGVKVPKGECLTRGDQPTITPPVIVKPNSADNSFGVTLVKKTEDYAEALEKAFAHSENVIVEEFIPLGREVRCGVIDFGEDTDELLCLPLQEYALDTSLMPIRTFENKLIRDEKNNLDYRSKDAGHSWIVSPDDPDMPLVWKAARQCHYALGCRHYGLFDFRIDPSGQPWFIEAGLYCSFSPKSVLTSMAAAAGTPLETFFDQAVAACLASSAEQPVSDTDAYGATEYAVFA
ncbi:MAG: D-alanine--D-alanine ligase [Cyanobacteria bacterium J06623_4]